jgi:hypothetical protein
VRRPVAAREEVCVRDLRRLAQSAAIERSIRADVGREIRTIETGRRRNLLARARARAAAPARAGPSASRAAGGARRRPKIGR